MKFFLPLCAFLVMGMGLTVMAADTRTFHYGGMEVIALADVDSSQPATNRPELLVGLTKPESDRYLVPGAMANSINAFVVKMNGRTILFDTGLGGERGRLLESLQLAGMKPEDIDAVLITHFHGDHVGGLERDGKAVFPNAHLYASRLEKELNPANSAKFLTPYADRTTFFEFGEEVLPGITAEDTRGHTPGHTAFLLQDGAEKLAVIGDLIHFAGIQLPLPHIAVTYDMDPVQAVAARETAFDRYAADDIRIASMHLPFPAVGTLAKDGQGYTFNPAQ